MDKDQTTAPIELIIRAEDVNERSEDLQADHLRGGKGAKKDVLDNPEKRLNAGPKINFQELYHVPRQKGVSVADAEMIGNPRPAAKKRGAASPKKSNTLPGVAEKKIDPKHARDASDSLEFDSRYHYRREQKCDRCALSKKGEKDCFFPLQGVSKKNIKTTVCTVCRHIKQTCRYSGQRQRVTSKNNVPMGTTPSDPQSQASITAAEKGGNLKRKTESVLPPQPSSSLKHRRIHAPHPQATSTSSQTASQIDKAAIIRQVSRLNVSFQSFNDVTVRQVENLREHNEEKAAFEEKRRAYEESKRIYEESERAYAARQEWLVSRSDSASESLIEEAAALLSSVQKDRTLLEVTSPELKRFGTIFADFHSVQRQLSAAHKFAGPRAQVLFDLNKCMKGLSGRNGEVRGNSEGSSSR